MPTEHVQRLALALGTTGAYIVAGVVSAMPILPSHPSRGMFLELERERKLTTTLTRKFQRHLKIYEDALTQERKEHAETRAELRSEIEGRHDDAEYLLEIVRSFYGPDTWNDAIAQKNLKDALERMEQGYQARPPATIPEAIASDLEAENRFATQLIESAGRALPPGATQNEMAAAP